MESLRQFEVRLGNDSFIDIIQRKSFDASLKFYHYVATIAKIIYLAVLIFMDWVMEHPKEFLLIETSVVCIIAFSFAVSNYLKIYHVLKFVGIFSCVSKEPPVLFLVRYCWQIGFTAMYTVASRFICSCSFLLTNLILSSTEGEVVDETFVLETMNSQAVPNFPWGIVAYVVFNIIFFCIFVDILKYNFSGRTEFFRFRCNVDESSVECVARPDSIKIFDCHDELLYTPDLRNELITFLAGNIVLLGRDEPHLIPEGIAGKIVIDLKDSQKEFSYSKEQQMWLLNPPRDCQ